MSLIAPSPALRDLKPNQIQWMAGGYVLCLASLPGQTTFIAQFNTALRAEFGLSHGEFGLLYTAATLCSSICLIWAGALADRVPPRQLVIWVLTGLALVSLGMHFAPSVLIVGMMLFGLRLFGQGMTIHISQTVMARWFNRYRGRALAIAQMGVPSGEAVLPLLTTLAIAAFGWRQVWLIVVAAVVLVAMPLIGFLFRDPPDGARAKARHAVNPDAALETTAERHHWTRAEALRDPLFYAVSVSLIAPPGIGTIFMFHQAHLAAVKGWELTVFTSFFPVLALCVVLLSIVSGMLVDRLGAWRMLPFVLTPLMGSCVVVALLTPVWAIPLMLGGIGMTFGLLAPVVGALWAELYGTRHLGAIRALATSALVFASAVGPGIAGVLIDRGVDLTQQSWFYAAYCGLVIVVFSLLQGRLRARIAAP